MGDPFAKAVNRKTTNLAADAIVAIKASKTLKVVVKPNSSRNAVLGYNEDKKAYVISIKAAAENPNRQRPIGPSRLLSTWGTRQTRSC